MTVIDPFAHRAKALEAAAAFDTKTGIVHAVVYLGDQVARLNDLADTVACGPERADHDGTPLGEIIHDEATELSPQAVVDQYDLQLMRPGAEVSDRTGTKWVKTSGWVWSDGAGTALPSSSLHTDHGPITADQTAAVDGLTAGDLIALPDRATVYDSDGDSWTKTKGRWWIDSRRCQALWSSFPTTSADLIKTYGPIVERS